MRNSCLPCLLLIIMLRFTCDKKNGKVSKSLKILCPWLYVLPLMFCSINSLMLLTWWFYAEKKYLLEEIGGWGWGWGGWCPLSLWPWHSASEFENTYIKYILRWFKYQNYLIIIYWNIEATLWKLPLLKRTTTKNRIEYTGLKVLVTIS